jgi:hypothetical protein
MKRNATKENCEPLKSWLREHYLLENSYPTPTKAEKMHMALVSNLTLTQVCPTILLKL